MKIGSQGFDWNQFDSYYLRLSLAKCVYQTLLIAGPYFIYYIMHALQVTLRESRFGVSCQTLV